MRISKSKFCAGVQCAKRLYLLVHSPELAQPDAADQAIIRQGCDVGMLARKLFPGGVEVRSDGGLDQAIRATRELVANSEIPAIYEATFENGGVLVRVDVLHRRRGGWRLVEVKSSTEFKEEHLDDLGIQYRVVSRSGVDIGSICLAHINRSYVYPGGEIDPRRFLRIRNLTGKIKRLQPKLALILRSEFRALSMPKAPDIPPGPYCLKPITCEFFERCNLPRPDDHVGYLPYIHANAVEELSGMGVQSINDIPDDFPLNERQRRAATCVQTGQPWYDNAGIKAELATLKYPICYMDFETLNPAIPRFAGMRPYDQLPFEWSVHVQREHGATPEHYEFLTTDAGDPRREFISSLCDVLGKRGTIVVYNAAFESLRLSELANWLPEFAGKIKKIRGRLWDLLPIIRNHVYHPAFAGSYSLKSVLPALVPNLSYAGMRVANGQDAGLAWESLVHGDLDSVERDKIEVSLLQYCERDTLAMLRLLEVLRSPGRDEMSSETTMDC